MRKLIHSKFELDLSGFELSDNEENNWFSDSFFTKYSFPFEIYLDKDLDIATGFLSQYNSSEIDTYFDVKYVHGNKIEDAILEIESLQYKLSCVVRFGFEQLPSFDKKLSELSLENFMLPPGTSIYDHAQSIITKTWPDVNYNFPQIHTDKFNPDDGLWTGFQNIINNRVNGVFLQNTIDVAEDISNNANVMQAYPYLIYVLKIIMQDSGYQLTGDILTDQKLKNVLLFTTNNYFKQKEFLEQSIIKESTDYEVYDDSNGIIRGTYETIINLEPGKYELFGSINIKGLPFGYPGFARVFFDDAIIYSEVAVIDKQYEISLKFDNPSGIKTLRIAGISIVSIDKYVFDLTLNRIFDYDSNGNAIPTILNENKIDLTKSTQNMLVQDLIKAVKNWFNYDLNIVGRDAVMNRIQNKVNYKDALDFQDTEVSFPLKKFQTGISFLLKFQDIEDQKFKYLPVFQSKKEVLTDKFVVNDKTTTIEINGLPLPLFKRGSATTAYAFEDNDSKVYLVTYEGLLGGNNYCTSETPLLLPNVHLENWKKWFDFRINAIPFTWNFKKWVEDIQDLTPKTKIFAYKKYHIIKTINKTEVKPDLFDIEIETETLE